MPVQLKVSEYGASDPAELHFGQDVITIGRGSENDLTLPDQKVSRNHARLELRDDTWFLVDLGSKNKTFLHGDELDQTPRPLQSGDRIHIGDFKIVFGKSLWPSEEDTRLRSHTDNEFLRPVVRLAKVLQEIAEKYAFADEDVREDTLIKTINAVFDPRAANHPAVKHVVRTLRDASDEKSSDASSSWFSF
jgi:pSer/pThr/pTyr-binding forkhead associated (FHA) protein